MGKNMCLSLSQGSAYPVHIWGSLQGPQEPSVVTSVVLPGGPAGCCSHPGVLRTPFWSYAFSSCGFWKYRLFVSLPVQTRGRRRCIFGTPESACNVSHQSLDGGFSPAQAGSPQCITPLGGFLPMPDQNVFILQVKPLPSCWVCERPGSRLSPFFFL